MKLMFLIILSATVLTTFLGGLGILDTGKEVYQTAALPASQNLAVERQSINQLDITPQDAVVTALDENISLSTDPVISAPAKIYAFGNPAGCFNENPTDLTPEGMLANVQKALGDSINLAEKRQTIIWNGYLDATVNVTQDNFAFEYVFNEYKHPLTYLGDRVATTFLTNGFIIWFREYKGDFRLLAIPMVPGVYDSSWAGYLNAYWDKNGVPQDNNIYPVMKKLPCHWVIDQGYVSNEKLLEMFSLDWTIPAYLTSGRQYLASTCADANRISQEKIGYWDATSMCGPLAWTIMRDANGFPYRIGSWSANAKAFTGANPKWNNQPWGTFDPETFDLMHTDTPMPGYDFASQGDLYPGDIIYSYSTLYKIKNDEHFDHIFLVAGLDANNSRISVSNMVQNYPYIDCFISEIILYTSGERNKGVINFEWNGNHFGKTGTSGFDRFRWKWITYHVKGEQSLYMVRWGDTLETIAFDWKVSPESIATANYMNTDIQFTPGQIIVLPVPQPFIAG